MHMEWCRFATHVYLTEGSLLCWLIGFWVASPSALAEVKHVIIMLYIIWEDEDEADDDESFLLPGWRILDVLKSS